MLFNLQHRSIDEAELDFVHVLLKNVFLGLLQVFFAIRGGPEIFWTCILVFETFQYLIWFLRYLVFMVFGPGGQFVNFCSLFVWTWRPCLAACPFILDGNLTFWGPPQIPYSVFPLFTGIGYLSWFESYSMLFNLQHRSIDEAELDCVHVPPKNVFLGLLQVFCALLCYESSQSR